VTLEEIVIAFVRVVGSLFVLRWAFVGGIIAVLVDLSDLFMMNLLHLGGVRNYQTFDKWLDQVYMACFLIVALRWRNPSRRVAILLYVWRIIGVVAFELTQARAVLVLFPNVFEFWFLFVASLPHWRRLPASLQALSPRATPVAVAPARSATTTVTAVPAAGLRTAAVAPVLLALLVLKEIQEFALHWFKVFDGFTAVQAVQAVWDFVTGPFR
jgi:hypothetical protein